MIPRYKCHKEVRAFKIDMITWHKAGGADLHDYSRCQCVPVNSTFVTKHNPEVGGYYVLYDDGYESFSPAAAFEAGYTLIEEEKA